jgi:GT2 family glycosyltransferase/glycosyltransferase involved in cell wall biosynthesis
MKHFSTMAKTIVERFKPATVMDMGCAKGFLVEHLRDLGVEAWGRDISEYAISQVREDIRPFCEVGGASDPLDRSYDLITCIEVAEHLSQAEGEEMIRHFCQHAETVIFSSSPISSTATGYEEPTHINVHPPAYWKEVFARHDFYPDLRFEPGFVTPQALLFRKLKKSALDVAVFSHEPPGAAVALLRLAGIISLLEQEKRMTLHYVTPSQPELDVEKLLDCDVFVIHREFADKRFCKEIVRAGRTLGKIIVFELDDLLFNVPRSNPNHAYCQTITPDVLDMADEADFITVTTAPLREALEARRPGAAEKTHILPNFINLDIWGGGSPAPENPAGPCVVGWFGTATHDEDLAIIKPAICQIAREYRGKVIFKFWGYLPKELQGLEGVRLVRGSQPDVRLHARDLLKSQIDLAVAPLLDHPFNHAKSDLKWLEYSICHVPGIFSAITPYTQSVVHGKTGWLVDNSTEAWVAALQRFIKDASLRRAIAQEAYQEVRSKHCLDVGAKQWDALYRTFGASGRRPGAAAPAEAGVARQRAAASLLMFQGDLLKRRMRHQEAGRAYEDSLGKLVESDSLLKELVPIIITKYRQAAADANLVTPIKSLIAAAKSLAAVDQPAAAVRLFVDAVKAAEKTRHPILILQTLLEAGKEMMAHDAGRSREVLQLARQLAENLSLPNETKAAQALLDACQCRPAAARPAAGLPPAAKDRAISHTSGPTASPGAKAAAQPIPPVQVPDPAVSIIIPVFNHLDLTRQCLRALFAQTPAPRHEVIVVDNGSTDGTAEFLRAEESAGRLRAIVNPENAGFARACNQGARAARGNYVVFLNNDTEVQSNWLGALFALGKADPAVAAVGAKLLYPDGTIQHAGVALADCWDHDPLLAFHLFAREKADFPLANQRRVYQAVTAACMLARKSHFDQAGGFDEQFWNGYEDVDLCLRFQERGWLTVYEPASVVIHYESQSGSERFLRAADNVQRFHRKWLEKASPDVIIDSEGKSRITPTSAMRLYLPPSGKLVSIIILAHNQLRDTQQCLASLEKHTPLPHELILVDNGSTDGTGAFFRQYAAKHDHTRVILNRANLGFAAANNQGLACARGDAVLLLNNDTVATPGWLERMLATLELYPECGLVGSVSNSVSGPQQVASPNYSSLDQLPKFAAQWSAAHAGQSTEAARLVGFCLLLRRAVVEKIGGLDPQFGSGNFEDDDLCLRAGLAGFKLRIALDSYVHHTGGQTFKAARIDYRASMERNWELFKAKWGLPAEASLDKGYRQPAAAPAGLSLSLPLPDLKESHACTLEGRCWVDKTLPEAAPKAPARKTAAITLPPCALLGQLGQARDLFRKRQWPAAWEAAAAAISCRPYHPEAYLLLAEIAQAAGDGDSARRCGHTARDMAPGWAPPRQFLKGSLRGNSKPEWMKLPAAVADKHATSAPRLSVCLIAKNEEAFLAQCLRSVRGLASQIVVVDTGSTDRTVEIAREHGAEVHSYAWSDDFSAARNAALEHARGDWVLILDADEELLPEQAEVLAGEIRVSGVLGYRLPIIDIGREQEGRSYVPRLFRNAPALFFLGRVHEQAFSSIQVRCQQWGLKHQLGKAALLHHGYASGLVAGRNKIERNLRLLQRAIEELPGEPNLVMSLGLELVRSGKLEAGLERYWEAFHLLAAGTAGNIVDAIDDPSPGGQTVFRDRPTLADSLRQIRRPDGLATFQPGPGADGTQRTRRGGRTDAPMPGQASSPSLVPDQPGHSQSRPATLPGPVLGGPQADRGRPACLRGRPGRGPVLAPRAL